ncbi:hypothetical protein HOE425_332815 [Hoeflea sp. EC-HK425]|nr:hypothetical protein HOE425_332815 [Hoeflea sp. EC-HK425]
MHRPFPLVRPIGHTDLQSEVFAFRGFFVNSAALEAAPENYENFYSNLPGFELARKIDHCGRN